jgi:hypothetical protein
MLVDGHLVAEVAWILGHWYTHLWIGGGWVAASHLDRASAIEYVESWAKNRGIVPGTRP